FGACHICSPDTVPSILSTLSLHDALPILRHVGDDAGTDGPPAFTDGEAGTGGDCDRLVEADRDRHGVAGQAHLGTAEQLDLPRRSEEHTSELQSRENLVCRLLLEKKKYIT